MNPSAKKTLKEYTKRQLQNQPIHHTYNLRSSQQGAVSESDQLSPLQSPQDKSLELSTPSAQNLSTQSITQDRATLTEKPLSQDSETDSQDSDSDIGAEISAVSPLLHKVIHQQTIHITEVGTSDNCMENPGDPQPAFGLDPAGADRDEGRDEDTGHEEDQEPQAPQQFEHHNMATPEDLRRILRETLGALGPGANRDGVLDHHEADNPTLLDKLTTLKKRADMSKPPGPEVFRGTSLEDGTLWLSRMGDYLAHQAYPTNAERMRVVKMFLADRALIWFEGLVPRQSGTFEDFSRAFTRKYLSEEAQYATTQSLIARRQGPTEDPETYITDVILKGHMLRWDNDRIQQQLISGLDDKYKPQVIMARPTGLDETCSVIMTARHAVSHQGKELEGIQTALRDLATQIKSSVTEKKIAPTQPTNPVHQQNNRNRNRNGFRGTYRPVVPIVIQNRQPPRRNPGYRGPNQWDTQTQQRPDTCWTCGSTTHYSSRCPGNMICFSCGEVGHLSRSCGKNIRNNNFQRRMGSARNRNPPSYWTQEN